MLSVHCQVNLSLPALLFVRWLFTPRAGFFRGKWQCLQGKRLESAGTDRWLEARRRGFLDGDLKFDETVESADGGKANNSGRSSGSELVFGGYVNASLMFHVEEHGDFYIGVQYMPLGSATVSGEGREARLDLSGGVYFSAGINWPF